MELNKKNYVRLKDLEFLSKFLKGIQRWLESQKQKKWEEFKSTGRILYYIQISRGEFKVSTS